VVHVLGFGILYLAKIRLPISLLLVLLLDMTVVGVYSLIFNTAEDVIILTEVNFYGRGAECIGST
jgi:uncharacterized membrane protein